MFLPDFDARLAAYLAGESDADERASFERLMARDTACADAVAAARAAWRVREPVIADGRGDVARFATRVIQATRHERVAPHVEHHMAREVARRPYWTTARRASVVAAGLVCLLLVALFSRRTTGHDPRRTYTTTTGQRLSFRLPDGSRVTLAPRTILRVPADFGVRTRTVSLTGEAYFDIAQATTAPFLVQTGAVQARVLGTAFGVRHYSDDTDVRVAVSTGKVGLSVHPFTTPEAVVTAGHVGNVSDSAGTVVVSSDAISYTDWRTGRLVFHMAPVPEVLATLGRWYGCQFKLADPALASQHVTTSMDYRSSTEALGVLQLILDVDITVDGDVITLHPRRQSHAPTRGRRAVQDSFSTHLEVGR